MRTLYYNCPAGISGDMNLGAMVDLGVDPARLVSELEKLPLSGWKMEFLKDQRKGVSGTRCQITCPHEHHHRTFADIRTMIDEAPLDPAVKADAIEVFRVLAEAEGKVHGKPADAVHFHEVGAVDSILDITGAAVCWHMLGIDRIAGSTIELGSGTVKCAHGRMPVPAPATARLVEQFPVALGGTAGEATTPTGAALLAGKNCQFGLPVSGKSIGTGVGVGQRDDPMVANVLYVSLLEENEASETQPAGDVLELATNLDDMTPERVAFLVEVLLEAGALDAWQIPATFKKGRLGCVLSVLIHPEQREAVSSLIFKHSTTLGIRWRPWSRTILEREFIEKETPLGTIRIKSAKQNGKVLRSKIEFDDLRRIAREHNLSLSETEDQLRD
jgi:uncharacterized protein (TIGR00299 family) protein